MTEPEFLELVQRNAVNRAILERLPELQLEDTWLVSGSLYQTVWNVMTDRPVAHGIKDYDIFYFDPDTSLEAEDAVIRRAASLFGDLGADVEVKNQARVHLWYEKKYQKPYPPLRSSCESIDRFLAFANMVAIQPHDGGTMSFYVPGLADMAAMQLRPNRSENFSKDGYEKKCVRWTACWPELKVENA